MTNTKTSVLDKATAHFKEVMSGELKGPIDVPEWDAKIYYKVGSTMAQETRVIELTQQNKTTEALIVSLIQKACDEDGKPLFTLADKPRFMNAVDPKVVLRVVQAMGADNEAEQVLGN
tara:strand:+ start:5176 stop:5529 length:354 start_codon:yes stop_codon:yes gene_type:complete